MKFPAGQYYIGDLCYVFRDEWGEVCGLIIDAEHNDCREGQFCLEAGVRFAIFNTAYGDGIYRDQHGRQYAVDAGCIGCVSVADLEKLGHKPDRELGQVHEFTSSFETYATEGVIHIGDVVIDTSGDAFEEDEEEEEYYH